MYILDTNNHLAKRGLQASHHPSHMYTVQPFAKKSINMQAKALKSYYVDFTLSFIFSQNLLL